MNYYQMQKEEKVNIIKIISSKPEETLHKLDKIENRVGIENILPFYSEIIEIIKMGQDIDIDDLDKYYKLFSDTYHYGCMILSDAFGACADVEVKICLVKY